MLSYNINGAGGGKKVEELEELMEREGIVNAGIQETKNAVRQVHLKGCEYLD